MLRSATRLVSARTSFSFKMAPPLLHASNSFNGKKQVTYSTTALKRWSCLNNNKELPRKLLVCDDLFKR